MVIGHKLLLFLSIALVTAPAAQAQGMDAGYMQTMSPSAGLGPEQDSLLPPEVVPLDPGMANSLSASQAQTRQAIDPVDMGSLPANVPGLISPQAQGNTGDMRNQAFNQLYGNQNLPQNANQQIWRAGQRAIQPQLQPMQSAPMQAPPVIPISGSAPNLMAPGDLAQGQSQLGGPNYMMANNQQMQEGYVAQSQTLTGSSRNQPQQVNTKRGGLSNILNYAGAFGAGALTSGFWSNNPWMGAGMFATTMTGMGVRNNSRF